MITLYEPLGLAEGHKLLEIGLGSGYSVIVASEIVGESGLIVCVEIDPVVLEQGKRFVENAGVSNIILICGDGAQGYKEFAPYDRICLTAASPEVPPLLFEQLKPGGKLIAPVIKDGTQKIILHSKNDLNIEQTVISDVAVNIKFVPMICHPEPVEGSP